MWCRRRHVRRVAATRPRCPPLRSVERRDAAQRGSGRVVDRKEAGRRERADVAAAPLQQHAVLRTWMSRGVAECGTARCGRASRVPRRSRWRRRRSPESRACEGCRSPAARRWRPAPPTASPSAPSARTSAPSARATEFWRRGPTLLVPASRPTTIARSRRMRITKAARPQRRRRSSRQRPTASRRASCRCATTTRRCISLASRCRRRCVCGSPPTRRPPPTTRCGPRGWPRVRHRRGRRARAQALRAGLPRPQTRRRAVAAAHLCRRAAAAAAVRSRRDLSCEPRCEAVSPPGVRVSGPGRRHAGGNRRAAGE